ncbi:histidine kinase [Arthrobacter sp. AFG7.2]|uniref:GAF and ANTAR domain-containing protein n=1 Tax=Arthrobacter sp. AFG7.2 TaxID=1688693 RepID=UPI000C9EA54C|nr:GAF and ANTAR domain-containing protein [Arthrobacter sp. AFG7.2]PNI08706.1 histidine kinase [Arthrobacter sp. AFG7.2]
MVATHVTEDFGQLVDLIASTEDIKSVLDGLAAFAAAAMTNTAGVPVSCAVTLRRRKHTATIGGSSDRAVMLDKIEQALGDGPCIHALESGIPVLLGDVSSDPRWPEYRTVLSAAGISSALGVPMALGEDSGAVLDYFAPVAGRFTDRAVSDAVMFAETAGKALRLSIRIATSDQRARDLKAAMDTRTVIDLACGMIMAENRCSKDEAFTLLRHASSNRNEKLHVVAESLVERFAGPQKVTAHFDE